MVVCAILRQTSNLPMIVDENLLNHADPYRAKCQVTAAANIRPGRPCAITPAVAMRHAARDLAVADCRGGDMAPAAVSHVAVGSAPGNLPHIPVINDWVNAHVAGHQPRMTAGRGAAPTGPGSGIIIDRAMIGAPVARLP